MRLSETQMSLLVSQPPTAAARFDSFPEQAKRYPRLRYMGSKNKLLPWIWETLSDLEFDSALDLFSGTASVGYLLKAMGKRVVTNDFLKFAHDLATATVANDGAMLSDEQIEALRRSRRGRDTFIERTFEDIFFTKEDLRFLDIVWSNLRELDDLRLRALALASLSVSPLLIVVTPE